MGPKHWAPLPHNMPQIKAREMRVLLIPYFCNDREIYMFWGDLCSENLRKRTIPVLQRKAQILIVLAYVTKVGGNFHFWFCDSADSFVWLYAKLMQHYSWMLLHIVECHNSVFLVLVLGQLGFVGLSQKDKCQMKHLVCKQCERQIQCGKRQSPNDEACIQMVHLSNTHIRPWWCCKTLTVK